MYNCQHWSWVEWQCVNCLQWNVYKHVLYREYRIIDWFSIWENKCQFIFCQEFIPSDCVSAGSESYRFKTNTELKLEYWNRSKQVVWFDLSESRIQIVVSRKFEEKKRQNQNHVSTLSSIPSKVFTATNRWIQQSRHTEAKIAGLFIWTASTR